MPPLSAETQPKRSREDRLRELERERELYARSRPSITLDTPRDLRQDGSSAKPLSGLALNAPTPSYGRLDEAASWRETAKTSGRNSPIGNKLNVGSRLAARSEPKSADASLANIDPDREDTRARERSIPAKSKSSLGDLASKLYERERFAEIPDNERPGLPDQDDPRYRQAGGVGLDSPDSDLRDKYGQTKGKDVWIDQPREFGEEDMPNPPRDNLVDSRGLEQERKRYYTSERPPFPEYHTSGTQRSTAGFESPRERALDPDSDRDRESSRDRTPRFTGRDTDSRDASTHRRTTSSDVYGKSARDLQPKPKLPTNSKTLLVLLEEERAKHLQLESEYHKLISEVQSLQTNHLLELRNQERKTANEVTQLTRALSAKNKAFTDLNDEYQGLVAKYNKESAAWSSLNDKLKAGVDTVTKQVVESDMRIRKVEKFNQELEGAKAELEEKLSQRERDLKKIIQVSRERDGEWMKEKENGMKQQVHILQLEHYCSQRDEELKALKGQLAQQTAECQALGDVKMQLQELERKYETLSKRERQCLDELEQAALRERKLCSDLEAVTALQRKYSSEVERLMARELIFMQDIDHLKSVEAKLRLDVQDNLNRVASQKEELDSLNQQYRKLQSESLRLTQDNAEYKHLVNDLRGHISACEHDIQSLKDVQEQLRKERDDLSLALSQCKADLQLKLQELQDKDAQINNLSIRIDRDTQAISEFKLLSKEKLAAFQEKVSDLTCSLNEQQLQLAEVREVEGNLRQIIRQRDENIQQQSKRLSDLTTSLANANSALAKESYDRESLKSKYKEDLAALQDRLSYTKQSLESDLANLQAQLGNKAQQITGLNEELSRTKLEATDLTAERFRLEARISELQASEASCNRQIGTLSTALQQKEQEIVVLNLKQGNLLDQVRRLEDEVASSRVIDRQKDSDLQRLQSNVNELSKRLRSQVELLMDRDVASILSASPSGVLRSSVSTRPPAQAMQTTSNAPPTFSQQTSMVERRNSTASNRMAGNIMERHYTTVQQPLTAQYEKNNPQSRSYGEGLSFGESSNYTTTTERPITGVDELDGTSYDTSGYEPRRPAPLSRPESRVSDPPVARAMSLSGAQVVTNIRGM